VSEGVRAASRRSPGRLLDDPAPSSKLLGQAGRVPPVIAVGPGGVGARLTPRPAAARPAGWSGKSAVTDAKLAPMRLLSPMWTLPMILGPRRRRVTDVLSPSVGQPTVFEGRGDGRWRERGPAGRFTQ
jgi:hypothetical protein